MAGSTIWMNSSKAWEGRIEWSAELDIARSCSHVRAKAYNWKTDDYPTSGGGDFVGELTVGNESVSFSFQQADPDGYDVCIAELSTTIYHNSDGTGSCLISCSITKGYGTTLANVTLSGEKVVELETIHRDSTLVCTGGTLGLEVGLNIESDASGLAYCIDYSCGTASGNICYMSYDRAFSWVPPLELANQAPSSTTVSVKLTLSAYLSGTPVSSSTITTQLDIPVTILPTLSVEVSDAKGYFEQYGGYIQSRSALQVSVTSSGAYGSTISSTKIAFDDKNYTSSNVTTEVIKGKGKLVLSATVTDSRGRENVEVLELTVLPYEPPRIGDLTVRRCILNEDGSYTLSKNGLYLVAEFSASITSLDGKNGAAYELRYKKRSAAGYTSVDLADCSGKYAVAAAYYVFEADANHSYNVEISATDNFDAARKSAFGPSKAVFWSRLAKGLGFAFGKIAEMSGYLDMGWGIYMNENRIHGLKDPVDDDEVATKGFVERLLGSEGSSGSGSSSGTGGSTNASPISGFVESSANQGCYYRTLDTGETEWLNPPMETGVVYRTTDRLNGDPIYAVYLELEFPEMEAYPSGGYSCGIPLDVEWFVRSNLVDAVVKLDSFQLPIIGSSNQVGVEFIIDDMIMISSSAEAYSASVCQVLLRFV